MATVVLIATHCVRLAWQGTLLHQPIQKFGWPYGRRWVLFCTLRAKEIHRCKI
jgi:hypothetical protein